MWLTTGIIVGIVAGILMGAVSEIGYRAGFIKSNMILIDGSFALKKLRLRSLSVTVYIFGILIHLVTSAVFGAIYAILARVLDFHPRMILMLFIYVICLWLTMLLLALPVAGQGILGKKISKLA